ncbi:MAG: energy-coupling factor transporter ATPase [Clostridiaceae bacterium]|nr:energy-coupling factor transporter ATPase [Clostridiaceae bacterium]
MIETKDLVYEYNRRDENGDIAEIVRALDGVSLKVKKGDFIAVLGANGSGKSTFAKHLNGLLHPTEGVVYINGMQTDREGNVLPVRQMAGMVFQNPDNQIISGIVEEDVAFGPENLGVSTEEILLRVEESLKQVDMLPYRKHSPNRLSGGQKQRVAIAGVLAMHPQCIILDEATAMLDPAGRKKVLEIVMRLNKEEHITIILITHYMEDVTEADYIYVMKEGKIATSGTPGEVFEQKKILQDCALELPTATRIAQLLNEADIPVGDGILTMEELADRLDKLRG